MESQNPPSRSMPSSPRPLPPAGTGQEELEMVSGEASLPLHAVETGAGGDGGAPSASEEEADGSDGGAPSASEEEADGSDGGEEGDDMDEDEEGSDDSEMEDGEEEDSDSSSGYSPEFCEEQLAADLKEVNRVWEKMKQKKAAVASCCICMEPWTSDGLHRVCCIPCGHVYGRSCLKKWLRHCGGTMAKCPQCGESFEHKRILNLYATDYLCNECIHDQELNHLVSVAFDRVKETQRETSKNTERTQAMMRRTRVMERTVTRMNKEMTEFRGEVASLMEKMNNMIISKGGDDGTSTLTPDRMLKFLSRNWPKLPRSRSRRGHE